MNRKLIAIAAVATIPFLSIPIAQAQYAPNSPEKRAEEAAKQGAEQLRRFVHRTRMIYALNFYDFYKPE